MGFNSGFKGLNNLDFDRRLLTDVRTVLINYINEASLITQTRPII